MGYRRRRGLAGRIEGSIVTFALLGASIALVLYVVWSIFRAIGG